MMRFSLLMLCISLLVILAACGQNESDMKDTYEYTFRLAESHPLSHPTTQADLEFAKRVKERTDGRIEIIVHYDQSLGQEKSVIEQVQFGAIDFARVSAAPLSDFANELNVVQLPYLYDDEDHMWRVLDSDIGDEVLADLEKYDFIGFSWFDAGARSFYNSVQPIESLEDLQGLKFRIMESQLMKEMSEALGFSSIPLPYGQVYSSIQTGVIDGAENNFPSYLTAEHYKVAPYFTIDEHVRVPEVLIGSAIALEKLSEEDIAILKEVAKETTLYQRKLWDQMNDQARITLEEEGVIVTVLEDREDFQQAVQIMYERYEEAYGDLIQRIRDK